ncbi:MAG: hypothetical protein K2X32_04230 [Phycisphaerales bacterium]|nr:hypothetical protein [Phycisphaerales bacterium]
MTPCLSLQPERQDEHRTRQPLCESVVQGDPRPPRPGKGLFVSHAKFQLGRFSPSLVSGSRRGRRFRRWVLLSRLVAGASAAISLILLGINIHTLVHVPGLFSHVTSGLVIVASLVFLVLGTMLAILPHQPLKNEFDVDMARLDEALSIRGVLGIRPRTGPGVLSWLLPSMPVFAWIFVLTLTLLVGMLFMTTVDLVLLLQGMSPTSSRSGGGAISAVPLGLFCFLAIHDRIQALIDLPEMRTATTTGAAVHLPQ